MASKEPEMFRERLHKGYAQSMELTGAVAEEMSRYQKIKIFDTVANGRVMVLGDTVQAEPAAPTAKLSFYQAAFQRLLKTTNTGTN